ncbi:MAG: hypothetical protein U9Q20_07800 [Campylobacterota bacterium]|nr:hypothetical protein [Campylobacterota bacterium]
MKKYLFILSVFYFIGCGGSESSNKDILVSEKENTSLETTDNAVLLSMPTLPGVDSLPTEKLEIR